MDGTTVQGPMLERSYDLPESSRQPKRFIPIVILLVILAIAIFGAGNILSPKKAEKTKSLVSTPTPTEYEFPTDTPTPSVSPTPQESSPTPKPTINPIDKATGLDKSTLSVEVRNGSGEFGAASKASEVLKGFGYHIVAIGNADNFNYENTTIKVKSNKSDFLSLLKKDLGFTYSVGTASADLSTSASADAVVIVGK